MKVVFGNSWSLSAPFLAECGLLPPVEVERWLRKPGWVGVPVSGQMPCTRHYVQLRNLGDFRRTGLSFQLFMQTIRFSNIYRSLMTMLVVIL